MGYNIDGTKTVYDWYTKNSPPADSTTFKSSIEQLMNRNIGYNKKQWTEFEDTTGATVKKSGRGETFTFKNTERTEWTNHESGLIFRMTENAGGNFNGNGTWIKLTGFGGQKNDTMEGGRNADHFQGGSGGDTLIGNLGNDKLWGEAGNDRLYGGDGRDILYGGGGNDIVEGGADGDLLLGNDGTDIIRGGDGDDIILGGAGNDTLYGGTGNDIFYLSAGSIDKIQDFSVGDKIVVEREAGAKVTVNHSGNQTSISLNGKVIGTVNGDVKLTDIIKGDADGRVLKNL